MTPSAHRLIEYRLLVIRQTYHNITVLFSDLSGALEIVQQWSPLPGNARVVLYKPRGMPVQMLRRLAAAHSAVHIGAFKGVVPEEGAAKRSTIVAFRFYSLFIQAPVRQTLVMVQAESAGHFSKDTSPTPCSQYCYTVLNIFDAASAGWDPITSDDDLTPFLSGSDSDQKVARHIKVAHETILKDQWEMARKLLAIFSEICLRWICT